MEIGLSLSLCLSLGASLLSVEMRTNINPVTAQQYQQK